MPAALVNVGYALARRLVHAVLVILGVSVVVFILTHLIGDPVSLALPLDASHAQYVALRAKLNLDHPTYVLFFDYFGDLLRGRFGNSLLQGRPAMGLALSHVVPSLELGAAAILLSSLFGIPAGFLAAVKQDTATDRVIGFVSVLSISIASFWLALMLILGFAVELHWFPTSGYGGRNIVLPAIAAAALPFGHLCQVGRAAMIEELNQPYVRVARAKGLSMARTVIFHAARNAAIPVVTLAGFEFATIVGAGLIIIESVFNWPGIGYLTYQALSQRDFTLIQACIILIATMVVVTNLLVDMIYTLIDPRTRQ